MPATAGAGAPVPAQRQAGALLLAIAPGVPHLTLLDDNVMLFQVQNI